MSLAPTPSQHSVTFKGDVVRPAFQGLVLDDVGGSPRSDDGKQGPPKNIFEAAERGLVGWIVKTVERTLEFDVNQRDRLSRTALHWAAELGHVEVVETLIDFGCDPKLTECNGRTAIHFAARSGHQGAIKAMLENLSTKEVEALVNQPDNLGITPVFLALQKGEEARAAFEYLMECGARYNHNSIHTTPAAHDAPEPAREE